MQPPPNLSGANLDQIRQQAEAQIAKWKAEGNWSAGIRPHTEYQTRPLEWIVEKLGVPEHTLRWSLNPGYATHQWDGDRDPLIRMFDALGRWENCGVESATGTGKTFSAACLVLWFLAAWEDALVITSAPKGDQLVAQIWNEIGGLWGPFTTHFPHAELLTGKLRMKPIEGEKESWTAMAFVAGVRAEEEAAQKGAGFHREHMLIITEDTPGVDPALMTTFQHTRTDEHNLHLALGNPDHRNDPLHRFCFDANEQPRPGVVHVRISALDHPNIVSQARIIPGAIGARRLAERVAQFGKGTRLYESRIRGISPAEAEDALIKWEWCLAAAAKWADPSYRVGALALGADVADAPEGDPAAIARWQGACCTEVEAFQVRDASEVGERVHREATDPENPIDPRYIAIDNVGVGASAVNELRRRGLKVRWVSGGSRAAPGLDVDVLWSETEPNLEGHLRAAGPTVIEAERFDNVRSQVWWRMREDLRLGRIALPNDEGLFQDLCTPTYTTKNGKICVEKKEAIIVRLRRSPNKGDACCYGNFVRRRIPLSSTTVINRTTVPNVDDGLERRLAFRQKQADKVEREYQRSFKELLRARKRAKRRKPF